MTWLMNKRYQTRYNSANDVMSGISNMGNSNVVPYEQYLKNNFDSIVPSYVSSDIDNEILLLSDQRCSNEVQQTIVNDSNTNNLRNSNIHSSEECETLRESVDVPVRVSSDYIEDCALLESQLHA